MSPVMSLPFITEMAWKSALIAGAALLLVTLLRSRSPSDRAAVLRLGVSLLLLLPLVAYVLPALQVEAMPAPEPVQPVAFNPMAMAPASYMDMAASPTVRVAEAGASLWSDGEMMLAFAYFAGLLAVGLHLGAGLTTLRRWTRRAETVRDPAWTDALARRVAPGARAPRLLASEDVPSPLSWGWRNPVILLDLDSLDRTEDADAIVAHEMAHVTRRDWVALMFARSAVALFWFNPLVWLLEREIAQQAEEAADSHAVDAVEPTRYAQTLVTCAQAMVAGRVPANSIAASGRRLARRVRAVLDGRTGTPSGSRWTLAAMVGCIAFAAPVAALELIPAAPRAPGAPEAPATPVAAAAPRAPIAPAMLAVAQTAPQAPQAPAAPDTGGDRDYDRDFDIDIDEEAIEAAAEAAAKSAEVAAAHAVQVAARAEIDADRIIADVERSTAQALRSAAAAKAAGADGMMRGADAMESGARSMDEHAVKLRDPAYREKQIARAARRGETVTHQELIDAIPELQEGAREMREGAKEMRQAAAEMRRGGH